MAIYGRVGQVVTIKRRGVLADVQKLDGRKPDKDDREAVRIGSYVVVDDGGKDRLYHLAFLRADGGSREIDNAINAAENARSGMACFKSPPDSRRAAEAMADAILALPAEES